MPFPIAVHQQKISITGVVVDNSGEPIIGANVVVPSWWILLSYTQASAGVATYTPVLHDDGSIAYNKFGQNSQLKYEDRNPGKSRNWYMEAAFNYARDFGDHHVTRLVLYNQSKSYYPSTFSDIPQGYVDIVGRATYDWKSRYLAEVNVGYNSSENFAPEKRFGTFPAGSFGWITPLYHRSGR